MSIRKEVNGEVKKVKPKVSDARHTKVLWRSEMSVDALLLTNKEVMRNRDTLYICACDIGEHARPSQMNPLEVTM
jgi:hypothetical protein